MLPTPYTLTRAFGAASQLLDQLKARLAPQLRTRTVYVPLADGSKVPQLQRYYVTPKPCSDGAQATLRLLLKLQLEAVRPGGCPGCWSRPRTGRPCRPR